MRLPIIIKLNVLYPMKKIIAVDFGGSLIKSALVENNKILKKFLIDTDANKGKNKIIENLIEAINVVYEKDVKDIGIGMPGPANYDKGIFINPPNLKPLWNVNIKKYIQRKFRVNVKFENDANCAALAELFFNKYRNFIVLTLGTGIGCGVIIGRKLYKGSGNASEAGHMIIDKGKDFEDLCSGTAIKRRSKELFKKELLIKDLVKLAKKGNKKAKQIVEENANYMGIGIGNLVNIFDPEVIILEGGMKEAGN